MTAHRILFLAALVILAGCAAPQARQGGVPAAAMAALPPAVAHGAVRADPRVPDDVSSAEWRADMARFAAADAQSPPPRGGIVFVGSSSIRMWTGLAQDFPGLPVVNRGFGGSEIRDSTWYADTLVLPLQPRQVVFYAGDNDLNAGRTPVQVRDDFVAFAATVRRALPKARISFISIKPSPSRAQLLPAIRESNRLVRESVGHLGNADFIDVYPAMTSADGQPRKALFQADMLHMTPDGYAIWAKAVRPYLR